MRKVMERAKIGESKMRTNWLAGLVALTLLGMVGCAADQGEINRVQPDAIEKSILSGEWHFRSTVTESAGLAAFVFPGAQSMMERGVFEIDEDTLYFYRTYEYMTNTDILGETADTDTPLLDENGQPVLREVVINGNTEMAPVYIYRGAPIASWPITKHFDIKASYSSATGEKTNVISENTSDNKWYEREYMRVMWAGALHTWDFFYGWCFQDMGI